MPKFTAIKGKRVSYRLTHALIPEKDSHFDSWLMLCEYCVDVAEEEAHRRLYAATATLISDISDEIIATAEECDKE